MATTQTLAAVEAAVTMGVVVAAAHVALPRLVAHAA
jgi:hypothetical protein